MNQHTRIRQTATRPDPFAMAQAVGPIEALTWADYVQIGRERALADITAAAASWGRKPDMSQLDRLARIYAEQDAPAAVRKAHYAALQEEQDAEFGASGFGVGFYGVHRLGAR